MKEQEKGLSKLKHILLKKRIIKSNRPSCEPPHEAGNLLLTSEDIMAAIDENPRMLAPAIVLMVQYPSAVADASAFSDEMMNAITSLRKGKKTGPDCMYERYRDLYQLCSFSPDGRVKGVERKVRKNLRVSRETQDILDKLVSGGVFESETEAIEQSLKKYLDQLD